MTDAPAENVEAPAENVEAPAEDIEVEAEDAETPSRVAPAQKIGGGDLPAFLLRKLQALEYPNIEGATLASPTYQTIILWLEEEKIRLWNPQERMKMRKVQEVSKWYKIAKEYCRELALDEVAIEALSDTDPDSKIQVLDTLLSMAIHDIYQDAVAENKIAMPAQQKIQEQNSTDQLFKLIAPINTILEANKLPLLGDKCSDYDICAAIQIIHTRFCGDPEATAVVDLKKLPLGIESQDVKIRQAVAILRFLHNHEMRNFQQQINNVINELQQFTADPKTDSALGRVGR